MPTWRTADAKLVFRNLFFKRSGHVDLIACLVVGIAVVWLWLITRPPHSVWSLSAGVALGCWLGADISPVGPVLIDGGVDLGRHRGAVHRHADPPKICHRADLPKSTRGFAADVLHRAGGSGRARYGSMVTCSAASQTGTSFWPIRCEVDRRRTGLHRWPTEELCAMVSEWQVTHELHDLPPKRLASSSGQGFPGHDHPKGNWRPRILCVRTFAGRNENFHESGTAAVSVMVPNSLGPMVNC